MDESSPNLIKCFYVKSETFFREGMCLQMPYKLNYIFRKMDARSPSLDLTLETLRLKGEQLLVSRKLQKNMYYEIAAFTQSFDRRPLTLIRFKKG